MRRLSSLEVEALWSLFSVDHEETLTAIVTALTFGSSEKKKWISALPGSKLDRVFNRLYKKGYATRAQDVDWLQSNLGKRGDSRQQNSYRISRDGKLRLTNPASLIVSSVMEE